MVTNCNMAIQTLQHGNPLFVLYYCNMVFFYIKCYRIIKYGKNRANMFTIDCNMA